MDRQPHRAASPPFLPEPLLANAAVIVPRVHTNLYGVINLTKALVPVIQVQRLLSLRHPSGSNETKFGSYSQRGLKFSIEF